MVMVILKEASGVKVAFESITSNCKKDFDYYQIQTKCLTNTGLVSLRIVVIKE
jgi:hypothetical protein